MPSPGGGHQLPAKLGQQAILEPEPLAHGEVREVEALAGAVFQLLRVDVDVDDIGGVVPGNGAVFAAGVQPGIT
jgi:hypothetical protein